MVSEDEIYHLDDEMIRNFIEIESTGLANFEVIGRYGMLCVSSITSMYQDATWSTFYVR